MSHDIRLDLAENTVQDPVFTGVDEKGNDHGAHGDEPDKLLRRLAGLLLPLLSQILACHHGAAGSQGGKHIDEQHHDIVHKRDPGHSRLPHTGHHDTVRHSHKDCQHLFNDQRNDKSRQCPVIKNILFLICFFCSYLQRSPSLLKLISVSLYIKRKGQLFFFSPVHRQASGSLFPSGADIAA